MPESHVTRLESLATRPVSLATQGVSFVTRRVSGVTRDQTHYPQLVGVPVTYHLIITPDHK